MPCSTGSGVCLARDAVARAVTGNVRSAAAPSARAYPQFGKSLRGRSCFVIFAVLRDFVSKSATSTSPPPAAATTDRGLSGEGAHEYHTESLGFTRFSATQVGFDPSGRSLFYPSSPPPPPPAAANNRTAWRGEGAHEYHTESLGFTESPPPKSDSIHPGSLFYPSSPTATSPATSRGNNRSRVRWRRPRISHRITGIYRISATQVGFDQSGRFAVLSFFSHLHLPRHQPRQQQVARPAKVGVFLTQKRHLIKHRFDLISKLSY